MSMVLTRSDLLEFQGALPKHSRGRQVLSKLVQKVTCEEIRFEIEIEAALMAGIKADPEARGALGGGA